MDYAQRILSGLKARFLNLYTATELRVAAITKDPDSFRVGKDGWMKPRPVRLAAIEIEQWQRAIMLATNYENINRIPLYNIYERAVFDDTVSAAMDNRITRVKQTSFRWVDKNGNENEELTRQFQQLWFYDLINYVLEARFYGHSLVQVTAVNDDGTIKSVGLINRKHVKADKKIVTKEEGISEGISYDEPPVSLWTFEFGDAYALGLLCKVIPYVAMKNIGMGAWALFTEKYGMPIRTAITPNTDKKRLDELASMMESMGIDMWAVLQGEEKIELLAASQGSQASDNYEAFLDRCDNAIVRLLLGNDATISSKDNTGTYASISAMAELQEYRHWDDLTLVQHVINDCAEQLAAFGYNTANMRFEWDTFEEMDAADIIESIPKIAPYAELDWEAISEKTGIPILGAKVQSAPVLPEDPLGK